MSGYERFRNNAQRIHQLTSPVRITDIMVAPKDPQSGNKGNYLGEFENDVDNTHIGSHALVQRIGDHIAFMAEMANKEHELAHFKVGSSGLEMKPGSENEVTRLGFNEFSFYPKDRPLTLDEYHDLLERIRDIAGNCHQNLHLLLASFPVKWPDNKVYNIVVHVQCGKQPELYPFAKSVPSAIDAIYPNTTNPSFMGSSYYPKVLSDKIKSTSDGNLYTYDETVNYIIQHADNSVMVRDPNESIMALNDLKNALNNDKYCPPSKELKDCIDDSIIAVTNNNHLTVNEIKKLKDLTSQYQTNAIEESNRFQDAVNLILPKPSIITNGITTPHYGRFSFQQTIDYILSCDGNIAENAKALEVLEATKLFIEQGIAHNSTYAVDPVLINTIDGMISKVRAGLQSLDNADVTNFKNYMESYNTDCQQTYYQEALKIDRPDIFQKGVTVVPLGDVSYEELNNKLQLSSTNTTVYRGRALLNAIKNSIEAYNNTHTFYAPDSQALLNHISTMVTKYKIPFTAPLADISILDTLLKQYKLDCETRYSNHVRSIMPKISAQIGKTTSYGKELTLTEMATLAQTTLDDSKQRNVAREQLNYLRDYLLFSQEEKAKGTKHPLLDKIDQISAKLNKLDVAEDIQQQYDNFKGIDTTLNHSPLDKNDFVKINQCIIALEDALARMKKHFPGEDTTDISNKINELIKSLPHNPHSDPDVYTGITLKNEQLIAFKEGFDALGVLLTKIHNDNKVKPSESADLKLAIENYNTENFADKVEKVIKVINLLKSEGIDSQSQINHLSRILSYLSFMEALSPDCKKAITAIQNKLDKNETIDNILIQDLKSKLNLESGTISNMPYWYFPNRSYSDTITYDSTIPCRTLMSEFWCNAHICLDHLYATGWRSYLTNFATEKNPPVHSSEIVTSDSVNLEKAHTTNPQGFVSHMDVQTYEYSGGVPVNALTSSNLDQRLMGTRDLSTGQLLGVNNLDEAAKVKPKDSTYTTNVDKSDPNQLVITNPPFGPPVVMRKYNTHSLLPLPLSSGQTASVDTYTTNYYVRNVDAIINAFQLPSGAIEQQKLLNKFLQDLSGLTNDHTATAKKFYDLLDALELKVKGVPSTENNELFIKQIGLMRHYLDTKMLSLETYIILRYLEPIETGRPVKQGTVITQFKNALEQIQQKDVVYDPIKNVPIIPVTDIAKAVMEFRTNTQALVSDPENLDALRKACNDTECYMRDRYPEVHDEMVKLYFPEFVKIINLVEPLGSGLSDRQFSAVNTLKEEIKSIQRQALQFDSQGRPIFNPYEIDKILTEFNALVSKIDGEDNTVLTNLSRDIGLHIEVLKNNFEALNLGKEYFEEQIAKIAEQKKRIQTELNKLDVNKKSYSHKVENKWQYRDPNNESLEKDIASHFEKYLMSNSLAVQSPQYQAIAELLKQLNYLDKATARQSGKLVVMISEVIKEIIKFKDELAKNPLPSLDETYREMIADLQKKYPQIYVALNGSIARQQFLMRHQKLQDDHTGLKRIKKINSELPQRLHEFDLKKDEHGNLSLDLGKEKKILENIQEEQKRLAIQQKEFKLKYENLSEESLLLNSKIEDLVRQKQQMLENKQELLNSKVELEKGIDSIKEQRSQLMSDTKELKESSRITSEKLLVLNEKRKELLEITQQSKLLQQQLLQNSILLKSECATLRNKIPDLERRCRELSDTLSSDQSALLDRQHRLEVLGDTISADKSRLEDEIKDYDKRIKLSQNEFDKLDQRLNEIKQQIQVKDKQSELLVREADTLAQKNTVPLQELSELQGEHDTQTVKLKELSTKLQVNEAMQIDLDRKMSEIDELFSKKVLEISRMESALVNQDRNIDETKNKIVNNTEALQVVTRDSEKCEKAIEAIQIEEPKQRQVVEEKVLIVEQVQVEKNLLEEQVTAMKDEKARLEKDLLIEGQSLVDLSTKMDTIDTQFREIDGQKKLHEERHDEMEVRMSLSERAKLRLQEKEDVMSENVKRFNK